MKTVFTFLLLACISLWGSEKNLVVNGGFEQLTGENPTGWKMNRPNTTIKAENGNHYLSVDKISGTAVSWAEQEIDIQPGWTHLQISAKMKLKGFMPGKEGWQNCKLSGRYVDKAGKTIGYAAGPSLNSDSDWSVITKEGPIPKNAVKLVLSAAQFGKKGEAGFDEISVVAASNQSALRSSQPLQDAEVKEDAKHWGAEPVETISKYRGEVVLNGLWQFMPATGTAQKKAPSTGWGYIRVPGAWSLRAWWAQIPDRVISGSGPMWGGDLDKLSRAWYRRTFKVPASWSGRRILLDFKKVSTDAIVSIDGKQVGAVAWPFGVVDITQAVQPGKTAELQVLVLAETDGKKVRQFMETATAQVSVRAATLASRGITDDVILCSRPLGAHLDGVFIQTSVRKKEIAVQLEFNDVTQAGPAKVTINAVNADGQIEKSFTETVTLEAKEKQAVTVSSKWVNPGLWDFGKPNLYTLQVAVDGKPVQDAITERFGFREFWIDGKEFYLNGSIIRLRPQNYGGGNGMTEVCEAQIDSMMNAGFNFTENWPNDEFERGHIQNRKHFIEAADRKGFLVAATMGYMNRFVYDIKGNYIWDSPEGKGIFAKRIAMQMKRLRNHPSVIMWASSGNYFGHEDDQEPRLIGRRAWVPEDETGWHKRAQAGAEGIAIIKGMDPTRPLFMHHGAYVGDVHTVNMYLNMIPIQEREEWLSEYAKHGEMPFSPVEFGTPLNLTTRRGRTDHAHADKSEPLSTEWAAIYFGEAAYTMESSEYREGIASAYKGNDEWHYRQPEIERNPAFQQLVALYVRNTWRSWRTWGIPGGMIPWINAHGWLSKTDSRQLIDMPPFKPGRRGAYHAQVQRLKLYPFGTEANEITPPGDAMMANNGPTLAWIAGPKGQFTVKDHNFRANAAIEKQVILLNELRDAADYSISVEITVGGQNVTRKKLSGRIEVGQTLKLPVRFQAPAVDRKTDGLITISGTIGARRHSDEFAFRLFPELAPQRGSVAVVDPTGTTTQLLEQLGFDVVPWDRSARGNLIVIGRHALSKGAIKMEDIEPAIQAGARVIVLGQDPDWTKQNLGFRYARYLARRVFPIDRDHPVMAGLDAEDLRDWIGESTVVEPRPHYDGTFEATPNGFPWAGWRWGGRGSIATGAIEKPHSTAWRPILQCEFDLAFTPLMELDHGKGKLVWCTLDLEDHAKLDPAAEMLAARVFRYAATAPVKAANVPLYIGDEAGKALLDAMCLRYDAGTAADLKGSPRLAILGAGVTIPDAALTAFLRQGGRALVLPRHSATAPLGGRYRQLARCNGSLSVPNWPEASGLAVSDLRLRSHAPGWLVEQTGGVAVAADGLLGRKELGKGVIVYCQTDPELLHADEKPYHRYTRWRRYRVLAQLITNLGGGVFKGNHRVFETRPPKKEEISLATTWKARLTKKMPPSASPQKAHPDPGMSSTAKALLRVDADESGMEEARLPGGMETISPAWKDVDGEAVFRITIEVPAELAAKDLELCLGPVDDFDDTYVNGKLVGRTDKTVPGFWAKKRIYRIPKGLIKPGKNVIAVRVWDHFGGGGFFGLEEELMLRPLEEQRDNEGVYRPDYRADYPAGDDPYRYKRF